MVSYNIVCFLELDMLTLQNFDSLVKLVDLQFDVGVFLTELSIVIVLIPQLSLEIV